ncbi:murein biosynthesis integral membrane protein MurJ [Pelagicoccus sp. SDUM812002]|uniref:murein biosynthesis integral membrane protein MurJ n=1 Tax=Pelagicoccus sp. SDUM812002 TaxID=3041266 RepID=UPI00280F6C4B|nr:murein biosynthesis integral membrane protein MurJ [Pelagicoccus sp. SDUM812002]MDQ8184553.1 murein biosynthesis integral membrane protein MurJ [Pelagicoccus sp. SDUM812002]
MAALVKRIGLVSAFTMISRVVGLLRDMTTSYMLGASVWNSAFITAFTLPNLFRRLLGEGALTAALMPNLSEELEARGRAAVHDLVNKTLSWLIVVCFVITVLVIGCLEFLQTVGVSEKWMLAASLGQILFPYVLLICVAAILSAALNLFSRFGIPALTAVWLNTSMVVSLGIAGWYLGGDIETKTYWLCGGTMLGGALQMVVPGLALLKEGWKPCFDLGVSPRVREVAILTIPGVFGAAVFQINIMVSRGLAFSVSDSAAALLYYANRLVELPVGVFAIAISTVVFPSLTAAVASKRMGDFSKTYRRGILLCLLMSVPSAVGLCALAPEIIRLLFERGLFTGQETSATIPLVWVFAIGMPFYSFVSVETRAFYSLKDTKTPVKAAVVAFVINVILSIVLMRYYGAVGLAIATNAAAVVQTGMLHFSLCRKNLDTSLKELGGDVLRIAAASVLMGLVVVGVLGWLSARCGEGILCSALLVMGPITAGIGVYFGALHLLGAKLKRLLN